VPALCSSRQLEALFRDDEIDGFMRLPPRGLFSLAALDDIERPSDPSSLGINRRCGFVRAVAALGPTM